MSPLGQKVKVRGGSSVTAVGAHRSGNPGSVGSGLNVTFDTTDWNHGSMLLPTDESILVPSGSPDSLWIASAYAELEDPDLDETHIEIRATGTGWSFHPLNSLVLQVRPDAFGNMSGTVSYVLKLEDGEGVTMFVGGASGITECNFAFLELVKLADI